MRVQEEDIGVEEEFVSLLRYMCQAIFELSGPGPKRLAPYFQFVHAASPISRKILIRHHRGYYTSIILHCRYYTSIILIFEGPFC